MSLPVITEGTIGAEFQVTFRDIQAGIDTGPLDLTGATPITFRFEPPAVVSGDTFDRTAAISGDATLGVASYTTATGDELELLGGSPWRVQGIVVIGGATYYSIPGHFEIEAALPAPP